MSDYLNNLVARHLNLVEVAQPRLASRFEPVSAARLPAAPAYDGLDGPEDVSESITEVEPAPQRANATQPETLQFPVAPPTTLPRPTPSTRQSEPEPLSEIDLAHAPPEKLTVTRGARPQQASEFEQPTGKHTSMVEEERAQPVNKPAPSEMPAPPRVLDAQRSTQENALPPAPKENSLLTPPQASQPETDEPERVIQPPPQAPVARARQRSGDLVVPPALVSPVKQEVTETSGRSETPRQRAAPSPDPTVRAPMMRRDDENRPRGTAPTLETARPEVAGRAEQPSSSPPEHRMEAASRGNEPAEQRRPAEPLRERASVEPAPPADKPRRAIKLVEDAPDAPPPPPPNPE
ncbi:MAG: hypothetical protein WCF57_23730, partial [Pyrinomonadaceae bacterium]